MLNDQLATFTDRREAIALFNLLRGRDPNKPWPLLPILAFIAPGGSGKSLLLRYLREKECSSGGRPALPYAYLDFTLPHTPKELLPILMELRDQLQQLDDGQGKHLVFPRFDLGGLIAQSTSANADISSFGPTQVRQQLTAGKDFIKALGDLGSSLGYTVPYVAPLLAGLSLAGQIRPLKDVLSYLEDSTDWKWYRMHGTETGLGANAGLRDVLLRLHLLSMPGRPERDFLINELLPMAFLADLFAALLDTPSVWSKTANLVFFLDGFEALQNASSTTATRLLQVLTTKQRKEGTTDPLLLVVGSREYLPGSRRGEPESIGQMVIQSEQDVQLRVRTLYAQWQQRLPVNRHFLRLNDLYLTVELQDFGREDTRSYLLKLGEQKQASIFANDSLLVQTIDSLTHGHPLYLTLAAAAVLEANARGKHLAPADFELTEVSPDIVADHEDEYIRDYLLDLFLRQLSETERKELIFCALPRFLDPALLRVLLPRLDDIDRQRRWDSYQRLTFMRPADGDRIVFHPLVRTLLLRQLPADETAESDYYRIHMSLKIHFYTLANQQRGSQSQDAARGQAQIEEAYHALALGDSNPAIALGVFAQQRNLTLWEPLLEAVVQAPAELMPENGAQQAYDALAQAERYRNVQDVVTATILYTRLLTIPGENSAVASLQNNLGIAYSGLPGGDREGNLRKAIACYEAALQVRTRETFPMDWAATQNNLGNAYGQLPAGDRGENLRKAIICYEAALQIRTQEAFPVDWAATQNNLGNTYSQLPKGDREGNLRKAIACYEAALQVRTQEVFPADWAMMQNNLGIAYSDLPGGDREANLRQAIACYQAALEVYTREAFPVDWATTQNNLGIAYRNLLGEDREANLRKAIACYEAALEVRTREAFPVDWAGTQNNLGNAYSDLPGGDREGNLRQAIACYQAALQLFQMAHIDYYASVVSSNLEEARDELGSLVQEE